MPPRLKKLIIVIIIIAAVGFLGFRKYMSMKPPGGPGMMGGPVAVDVAGVLQQDVQLWNEFSGRLAAIDEAEIRPRVSGPIQAVHFTNGARVERGAPLFTIDPEPYRAELGRLQGLLAQARAQEALARTEFERTEGLVRSKAISQRELDQRQNDLNIATASVKTAEAALESARLNLEYTVVTAPITGRAGRAEVTVGNMVQAGPNAPMLTMIASENPIYADFDMDERTYLRYAQAAAQDPRRIMVKLGLASEEGLPHEGHIESFDNRIDPTSGTIRVRAIFDNSDGVLVPGLFARIRVGEPGLTRALLITDRAVGTDQDKKFVLALGKDGKAEYRPVVLGAAIDGLRVVTAGLQADDKIIVSGLLPMLHPGVPLNPTVVAMDAPSKPHGGHPMPLPAEEPAAQAQPNETTPPAQDGQ